MCSRLTKQGRAKSPQRRATAIVWPGRPAGALSTRDRDLAPRRRRLRAAPGRPPRCAPPPARTGRAATRPRRRPGRSPSTPPPRERAGQARGARAPGLGQPRLARLEQAVGGEQLGRPARRARGRLAASALGRCASIAWSRTKQPSSSRTRSAKLTAQRGTLARSSRPPVSLRSRQSPSASSSARASASSRRHRPALPGELGLGQALEPRRDRPGDDEGEDQAVKRGQHRDRHRRAHRGRIVHLREHRDQADHGADHAHGRRDLGDPAPDADRAVVARARGPRSPRAPRARRPRRPRRRRAGRRRGGRSRPGSPPGRRRTGPYIRRAARSGGRRGRRSRPSRAGPRAEEGAERAERAAARRRRRRRSRLPGASRPRRGRGREGSKKRAIKIDHVRPSRRPAKNCRMPAIFCRSLPIPIERKGIGAAPRQTWHVRCSEAGRRPCCVNLTARRGEALEGLSWPCRKTCSAFTAPR